MGVVLRGLPAVKADASSGWAELPAAMQEQLRQQHGIGKSFGFDFDDCDGRMVLAVLKESLALQKDRYQEAATLHACDEEVLRSEGRSENYIAKVSSRARELMDAQRSRMDELATTLRQLETGLRDEAG